MYANHSINQEGDFTMKRAMLSLVLGLLGFALLLTSVALAAPSQPLTLRTEPSLLFQDPITDTDTLTDTDSISPTTTMTHPVASKMAEYFEVDCSEIEGLHEDGFGFGVIARAYFVGEMLGITPTVLLDEFTSGKGWGVILKEYELHPGLGRDKNLGYIMSGRWRNDQSGDSQGAAHMPPGQLKKSDQDDDNDRGHGPSTTPPGHDKDKGNNGKKK
jgi:hypothetical protein